ncbi:MetQ/NlpA family ABC transporter substrate-binding protein [Alkalicoccobacillus porphyridii]|uniref:Lipoprotein n=1 Tax=Alkalicoccobacillus porphyridii TaxID=2597270 RepID=A0A554A1S1_9BACI|nr:MetQ/NlpA family ABC transporter substrate-binding protein [Alkalicoccobacillus porphyridii]TSB47634.1 MetQ/NlpA family ABC transporter substrate-binding protein [Alkalicoccobacillus porphyridii]
MKQSFKLIVAGLGVLALTACGQGNDDSTSGDTEGFSKDNPVDVRIGISGTDSRQWDFISEKAVEEGINIDIVSFNDYVQPNQALADGDIDANAFQTVSYFDNFREEQGLDLEAIGTTILAPLGVYSDRYDSVDDIPDGAEILIANEVTNQARNLMLLQEAGLIELEDDFGITSGLDQIADNPKNLKLTEVVPANAPRLMQDVDAAVINNGIAVDAGLSPTEDSLAREDETATPYINIIAARTDNADDPALQRLVEIYQSDEVKEFIEEEYQGATIPTYISLEELNNYPR